MANQGRTSSRGFASMDPAKQRAIASKGGQSVPPSERSFSKDPELAASAGRKGGMASHGSRAARAAAARSGASGQSHGGASASSAGQGAGGSSGASGGSGADSGGSQRRH
ncbi:MAG: general stress protein [Pseudomonadota bacterium]